MQTIKSVIKFTSIIGLLVLGLSTKVNALSNTLITAEVCSGGPKNYTLTTDLQDNSMVSTSPLVLNFKTNYIYSISTNKDTNQITKSDLTYGENQTFSQTLPLVEGANVFTFNITGGCPKTTELKTFTVTYNPNSATLNPVTTNISSPKLSGKIPSKTAKVIVNINGKDYEAKNNGDGTWTLPEGAIQPELADGKYDVTLKITDPVSGNTLFNQTFKDGVIIDSTAPKISLISDDVLINHSPSFKGTIDDSSAKVIVNINGKDYEAKNNGDGTWTLPEGAIQPKLVNGDYQISVYAIDQVGNKSDVITKTIKINADGNILVILPPLTGYLRINQSNIPIWIIYLVLLLIAFTYGFKKFQKAKN